MTQRRPQIQRHVAALVLLAAGASFSGVQPWSSVLGTTRSRHSQEGASTLSISIRDNSNNPASIQRRRTFNHVLLVAATLLRPSHSVSADTNDVPITFVPQNDNPQNLTVYQLPSGLKYVELVTGTGPSPRYGQLCVFTYRAFLKLPATASDKNPKPQQFDADPDGFVHKHGSNRLIPGLDEGLHTMQVGGTRRLLIPPKLGYVQSGLGPIPETPWDRAKLNNLLEQMVQRVGGTLIFEVTLRVVVDDEADQGYYDDDALSPEDFATLRTNLQQQAADARAAQTTTTAQ